VQGNASRLGGQYEAVLKKCFLTIGFRDLTLGTQGRTVSFGTRSWWFVMTATNRNPTGIEKIVYVKGRPQEAAFSYVRIMDG